MSSIKASAPDTKTGYKSFELGRFSFSRDEYFVTVRWPAREAQLSHTLPVDAFLRALVRDVAWGFFYGWVNFDSVLGTRNRYGQVELYAGRYNDSYRDSGLDYVETFDTPEILATFKTMLSDWTNAGFDPFAAPAETGTAVFGKKNGSNTAAIERNRETCRRMPGLPGDASLRSDANGYPVNRAFTDVEQDEPEIHAEPGFENEVHAFNLFKYLSRSDVTWNPFRGVRMSQQPVLPDHRGTHPAGHSRQRPGRVVYPGQRSDHLAGQRQGNRPSSGQGGHEARRCGGHAGRYSTPGLFAQAGHAAGLGKRDVGSAREIRQRRALTLSDRAVIRRRTA